MKHLYFFLFLALSINVGAQNAVVTGELKQYHKTTLTWSAENLTESTATFKDYRLNVTFTSPAGNMYLVPGYFAADGNAFETSATTGDKWRCHFNPLETGVWSYSVSFKSGTNIAASLDVDAGSPIASLDGDSGTFTIGATDKSGKDFKGKGKLEYVGDHYLRWTTGEYYLKVGSNSPDNFLEYNEFDNTTYHKNGDRFYPDHVQDWENGDPTWKNGFGKGLIGVVNYLSEQDVNAQYVLTDNTYGDTDAVFPWTQKDSHFSYDCSKLDQWQIIFDHMVTKGIMVHLVLSEAEQQSLFELASDAQGDENFADARKIYFREMVARFGYINALTWNIGEENGWNRTTTYGRALTSEQQISFANYIDALTYYNDHITVHNGPAGTDKIYTALLGDNGFTGPGMQGFYSNLERSRSSVFKWKDGSITTGKKWVVTYDEAYSGSALDEPTFRANVLWATITAGGAGMEHYFPGRDLVEQNFRSYEVFWEYMNIAHDLFSQHALPFWEMESQDTAVNISTGWCLGKTDETYIIYLEDGGTTNLDLVGDYIIKWYNPREGGALVDGSVTNVQSGTSVNIGTPPNDTSLDWVAVLQNVNAGGSVTGIVVSPEDFEIEIGTSGYLNASVVPANAGDTSVLWNSSNSSIASVDQSGLVTAVSLGQTTITATSNDGRYSAQSSVVVFLPKTNLSLNKITEQSSTSFEGISSRAVDGDTSGAYGNQSVTHTSNSTNPWWKVDLEENFIIDRIEVYNRTDNCCKERLVGAKVYVGSTDSEDPADYTEVGTLDAQTNQIFDAIAQEARYVFIHLEGTNKVLSLAEVEVYGHDSNTIPVTAVYAYVDNLALDVDATTTLNTTIVPANATKTQLLWTSSDNGVATVDDSGYVTAIAPGTTTLTVTTVDGGFSDTVLLTVNEEIIDPDDPDETPVSFSQNLPNFTGFEGIDAGTSLMFGPDGRLYVTEYQGNIKIYEFERDEFGAYNVLSEEILTDIKTIQDHNDDGSLYSSSNRETLGLAVVGTATNPIIYVTSSDFRIGGGSGGGNGDLGLDTNSGVITRFTKTETGWDVVDIVRGLPRSEENHATNGLEFVTINGVDYLIVAQGGHTNGGSPSTNFAYTGEYALSAAVLSINLDMIEAMPIQFDNGRAYIYDLPTLDDPSRDNVNGITDPNDPAYDGVDINDPWGGNDGLNQAIVDLTGPVQIYSPGYRNAYDLVVTESGALYVTDNGANGGWGGFPENEGDGPSVTNNYVNGEPGSSSSSGGEQINNEDNLIKVTSDIQTYVAGSFYGGHPNPTRANPQGAGLFIAPSASGLTDSFFRTQIFDPNGSEAGSTTDASIALPANWPPVSVANPVEGDWRGPGISNPDGPDKDIVTTWGTNTNGIDEYTASNFGGAMKGDLIAGVNSGVLRRVQLTAGGALSKLTTSFASGLGGNPLGITCNSDTDPFPGTIWAVTLEGDLIVLEPQDFIECIDVNDPEYDLLADYDGDGYTNQDEIDNGTEICNGASQPDDFDKSAGGILVSNLNDTDDDNDGILDKDDPFQMGNPESAGNDAFQLPVENELFSSNPILQGYLGLGFTGLMNNGADNPNWLNWLDRRDDASDPNPNDILGGAIGAMTMQMTSGTALGLSNSQEKAFQYGIETDSDTGTFTVEGSLVNFNNPLQLYGSAAPATGELGIFIGDGTQSNYIKFVLTPTGIQALQEIDDVPQPAISFDILPENRPQSGVKFFFVIDPSTGNIGLEYEFDGNNRSMLGNITSQGTILEAIQSSLTDLAVGLIGSSNTPGVELEGTWDLLNAYDEDGLDVLNYPIFRLNAAGDQVEADDAETDWFSNDTEGSATEVGYSVTAGFNYNDSATLSRHASIPDYITEQTFLSIFDQERFNRTTSPVMEYQIPMEIGNYNVNIYMGNVYDQTSNVGDRLFDIEIEGIVVGENIDLVEMFGHQFGGMVTYRVGVADGTLNVRFLHVDGKNNPIFNALEVLGKGPSGTPIIVNEISNQINSPGEQLDASLAVGASGGDGNLVYTATNLPPGVILEPTNGSIGGTIDVSAVDNSPYLVTINVDDSDDDSDDVQSISFEWTIIDLTSIEPVVRVNAAGSSLDADDDSGVNWEANDLEGAQSGPNYSVTAGFNYDDSAVLTRHSSIPDHITEATFLTIFDQERFNRTTSPVMDYQIPVGKGTFIVNVYVGNVYDQASNIGDRAFNIEIEGEVVGDGIDPVALFGHQVGGVLTYPVTTTDGILNIKFLHIEGKNNPILSGIEVMADPNQVPDIVLEPITDRFSDVNEPIEAFSAKAIGGLIGETFEYSLTGQPLGISIDPNSGEISGTVDQNAVVDSANGDGNYTVTVEASKPSSITVSVAFNWKVTDLENLLPVVRINAAGTQVTADDAGVDWEANELEGAQTGTSYSTTAGFNYDGTEVLTRHVSIPDYISDDVFLQIFDQEKFNRTTSPIMEYKIPLGVGNYNVNIYLGNIYEPASNIGDRLFDIEIEGVVAGNDIDVIQLFGHEVGGMINFPTFVDDGELNIRFLHIDGKNNPIFNAIEVMGSGVGFFPISIAPIADQNNEPGDTVDLQLVNASGGDDALDFEYAILGQPNGIGIDAQTGALTGVIELGAENGGSNADGFYTVQITASRGDLEPGTVEFIWRVGDATWFEKDEDISYTGRHECSLVQAGEKFYLMGGRENSMVVEIYDYGTNTWEGTTEAPPAEFNHYQATEYQGLIWVIGAFKTNTFPIEEPTEYIWAFDPVNRNWIQGPKIPVDRRRGSSGLVIYNDKFYVVGGNTIGHNGGYVSWFDEFDPATGVWTPLQDAPRARDHFHATVIGNKLYAAGGRLSGGPGGTFSPVIPEVDIYDFTTGTWSTSTENIPTPRAAAAAVNFNDKLVVMGGEVQGQVVYGELVSDALKVVEEYDPAANTWSRLPDMNHARHGTQAIQSGGGIYILGGSPNLGGGNQQNMEYYGSDSAQGNPLVPSELTGPETLTFTPGETIDIDLQVSTGNMGIFIDNIEIIGSTNYSITAGALEKSFLKPGETHQLSITLDASALDDIAVLRINHGGEFYKNIELTTGIALSGLLDPNSQFNYEGDNVSLAMIYDDPQSNPLFEAINLPPGLTINGQTGLISGIVQEDTANGVFKEEDGLVVVEAETASIPSNWLLDITDGETGIQATTNHFNNRNGATISYTIKITTTGVYRFLWNSAYTGGDSGNSNDSWLRFPNNDDVWFFGNHGSVTREQQLIDKLTGDQSGIVFPIGSSRVTAETTPFGSGGDGYFKVYRSGGVSEKYAWEANVNDEDAHQVYLWFVEPGDYTFQISERSAGHRINTIALYKVDGFDYASSQLDIAPQSQIVSGTGGAADGSSYNVTINYSDDVASDSVNFDWVIGDPGDDTPPGNNDCSTQVQIQFDDFESGYGNWNDGGTDSIRNSNSSNANSGSYSINLQDNTGSSLITTNDLDLSQYNRLTVEFSYLPVSFESGEDFWLQVSLDGGQTFNTVEDWVVGDDFTNGQREQESVEIDGPFTSNTQLRFRADASGDGDDVYLDDILVLACNSSIPVSGIVLSPNTVQLNVGELLTLDAQISPNNATNQNVVWTSDDESIAGVNQNGEITGIAAGQTTVTVTTLDGSYEASASVTINDVANNCTATGTILMERYDGVASVSLSDLFSSANYPDNPTSIAQLDQFEIPVNVADNYGVRVSGYICPPETGTYYFWVSGDDESRLDLSSDDNPNNAVTIANVPTWTQSQEWNKFAAQKSVGIVLEYGKRYFIRAFMQELGGGDNLAVGWRKPSDGNGTDPIEVIPGNVLSPFVDGSNVSVTGVAIETDVATMFVGESLQLAASVTPSDASDQGILWTSDAPSVISISQSGEITANAPGNALLTATSNDGGFTDMRIITVSEVVSCTSTTGPPIVGVITADSECGLSNGSITFSFGDTSGRTHIEFSNDGGLSYLPQVPDTSGIYEINNVSPGSYHCYVRWGNTECPVNLGTYEIVENCVNTNDLPWHETFNDLSNGTTVDNLETAWSVQENGGTQFVVDNQMLITESSNLGADAVEAVWTSEVIDINGIDDVTISFSLNDLDNSKESTDYLNFYYILNGGQPVLLQSVSGNINSNQFTTSGISGNNLQLMIASQVSWSNEVYVVDDISVEATTNGPVSFTFNFNFEPFSIDIYPNPTSDILNIKVFGNEGITLEMIYIYGMDGRLIGNYRAQDFYEDGLFRMDLSSLPSGIYNLIMLDSINGKTTKKVIKR